MRYFVVLLIAFCIGMMALPVAAQDTAPTPPTDPTDLQALVDRAEDAALRAESALEEIAVTADRANSAIDLASNMFGLFEVFSGVVGLVLPVLVVIAGLLGWRRLEAANQELREAKERFEKEISDRSRELIQIREELEETARNQRENATSASIALSLLPVAERQYRAQDFAGALDTYARAVTLDEKNPIIHYRLGYVHTQSGHLEEAQTALKRALSLDPSFIPAKAALGYVFRRLGDAIQKDIDKLEKSGLDSTSPDLQKLRTERDKIYIESEKNFVDALDKLPKLMDEDGESWWGALGGLYRRRGQTKQAINAYERGTQITPQSSYPFSNLALLYAETDQLDRMRQTYARVEQLALREVQASVDNYWAYADLVVSRIAQGKVTETYDVIDTTLKTAPTDSPYTFDMLIETLMRLSVYVEPDLREKVLELISYIRDFVKERDETTQRSRISVIPAE